MKSKYIIIDGTSYIYRAFFAMPPLTAPNGQPTGVVYGVINMIKKLLKQYPAELLTIVFDPPGPTSRHKIFPEYKANRSTSPPELIAQIEPTIELINLFGWQTISITGIEADDVIGSLAIQAVNNNYDVLISTADKDFAQLVQPNINLINTLSNQLLDIAGVKQKFQVEPRQIVDYLALIGDSSDNIPGINKVGPKTAVKWLTEWGSIEGIIANIDKLTGKVAENLKQDLEKLALYQQLVTIDTNIAIDFKSHSAPPSTPNQSNKLTTKLNELGFNNWAQKPTLNSNPTKIKILKQLADISKYPEIDNTQHISIAYCKNQNLLAIATQNANVALLNLNKLTQQDLQLMLDRILNNKLVIGYDLKQLWHDFKQLNILLPNNLYDIMIYAYISNNKNLLTEYLQQAENKVHPTKTANLIYNIYIQLTQTIPTTVNQLIADIEMPLIPILATMESNGVLLDTNELESQNQLLINEINNLQNQIWQLAGTEFNLNSPKQVREVLFEQLQLPIIKKTNKGEISTAESTLTELAVEHEIADLILKHRHISKLQNTYCAKLAKEVDAKSRIHCTFTQVVTSTGRLSSVQPNLQNIPIKTEIGRNIRKAFIAPNHSVLISADYNQIELRVMAHFSQDETLLNAFHNNQDIHSAIAKKLFNCSTVSPEQRRLAKTVNFGLIYGMSAFGLAQQLKIPRQAAQELINDYFNLFPKVKAYLTHTKELAQKQGFVSTLLGRKVFLESSNNYQQANLRAAINAPIQGTAAEIIKLAMLKLDQNLIASNSEAKLILQIHDELIVETPETELEKTQNILKKSMEEAIVLNVPLIVAIGTGKNWATAH